jgi:simple sugar transport system permease protein
MLKRLNPVPVVFLVLFLVGLIYSGMSPAFVFNDLVTRFCRDGILVLALVLPIAAGMGINFAIVVGAMCAQAGLLTVIILQINGAGGFLLAGVLGIALSTAVGYLIGRALNRVKGKEMMATIIIGLLVTGIYQLVFMVGYGTVIPARNPDIVLSRGIGVRSMVDLAPYRSMLDNLWTVDMGRLTFPVFMILVVLLACLLMAYLVRTRLGKRIKAVGDDMHRAQLLGVNVNRTRAVVMILSLVIACIGQMVYLQNIGMLSVYTAHGNSDTFSAAAILAGGATIREARVRNVILGIFLFHALFIVSPQAGQNIFGNPALGEYFRSFIAYGTIALALILNARQRRAGALPAPAPEAA